MAVMVMAPNWGWGQTSFTATYTFGSNGDVESFIYNGDPYDGITMGTINKVGVTSSSSSGNFRATDWPTGATNSSNDFTGSVDFDKYIGFTINAATGYKFTVTSITFGIGRSGTGTRQSQWRGSADTYGSIIDNYTTLNASLTNSSGVLTNPDENNNWTENILIVGSNYVDITTSAGFRYFLFNSEGTTGTAGLQGVITISGTFEALVASPTIAAPVPTSLSDFSAVAGTASSAQTFTISGTNLTADLVVTAPTDYEVRENNVGNYGTSVSFTPSLSTVSEKTLQVRIASSAGVGTPSGNVACTSTDAATQNVEVSGTVYDQINWCNIQSPASGTINLGGDFTVNAQVNKSGVTDASGQGAGITAWIGYGTTSSDLSGYTWVLASYNKDEGNNDEYMANIGTAISPTGTYYYASRFQLGSSPFYVYGGYNAGGGGFWNGITNVSGVLTVEPISVPDVIITEVYGGGGNSGATWKNDFIELFNTTSSPIDISGWSIQYYSAEGVGTPTGTTNTFVIPEDKSIPAKSNFLIQAAAGGGGTLDLLLPDAICNINLSATEGKVIIYTTGEAQTITSALASITGNTYFKDYVPYGKAAVPVWGSAMSSNTSSTTSATRKTVEGSYVYTQNIGNDFEVIAPTPQNTGIAYFRSKDNGKWVDISTWESSSDNNTWIAAVSLPLMKDNVVIDHAVTVAVDGTADCYNLTINGGGSLNIASDASRTGSLIARGVVSGNTTVQRYLTGGWGGWDAGWHQISSPVAAQVISAFETTGVGNGYDFYGWEESTSLWMNYKADGFSVWNGGTNFNVGQGYMVSYEAANITQTYTGVLNAADVTKPNLSYNLGTGNGWHLLGNPFASALTWNDGNWALNNVAGGAKIWNEAGKSYSDIAASGIIPSAQGFMVQLSSTTNSITIPAASRVHNTAAFYKSGNEQLLLVAAEIEGGSAQESKIIVNPMATEGFDFDYDSRFLAGYAPLFYSVVGDELLSTNSLPELNSDKVIPFGFVKNAATAFTIELKESIPGRVVYLTDVQTGVITNLSETPEYSFISDEGDDADRFTISFGFLGINNPEATDGVHVYAHNGVLYLETLSKEAAQFKVYNLSGQLVMQGRTGGNALSTFNVSALGTGVYVVNVILNQGTVSQKLVIRK